MVFNGVVGRCEFDVSVVPLPLPDFVEIDGESPKEVEEGGCQTMSVRE